MPFEVQKDEPMPDAVRRLATERLDEALSVLNSANAHVPDEAVHTARKRLKEARATLRLVRDDLGKKSFDRENRALRDSGRPLSEVRDAAVMIETLDELIEHFQKDLKPQAFHPFRKALLERHRTIQQRLAKQNTVKHLATDLAKVKRRAADWSLDHAGWKAIAPGLKRTYKQGIDAMDAALEDADDECLHEWRKRCKDLRYQLEMLCPVWPELLVPLGGQAHELTDQLGKDHDLAVLAELAKDDLRDAHPKEERRALIALIERRRRDLQSKATKLGRKLYAEPTADFVSRIKTYWHAWQSDSKPPKSLASAPPE